MVRRPSAAWGLRRTTPLMSPSLVQEGLAALGDVVNVPDGTSARTTVWPPRPAWRQSRNQGFGVHPQRRSAGRRHPGAGGQPSCLRRPGVSPTIWPGKPSWTVAQHTRRLRPGASDSRADTAPCPPNQRADIPPGTSPDWQFTALPVQCPAVLPGDFLPYAWESLPAVQQTPSVCCSSRVPRRLLQPL